MFRNHLKIAWRSLAKNRLFTALNGLGLATGLAVALLLLLYARDERAFDRHHSRADRMYRVNVTASFDNQTMQWGNVPNVVGPTMKAELPDVEAQVRLLRHNFGQTAFVNSTDRQFAEKRLYWADSTLFAVFDVPLKLGNPTTALNGPNQVILSESASRRYFGQENPLGKVLEVDHNLSLEVAGVYEDFRATSTLDADLIGSFSSVKWANHPSWGNASFETYLLLRPGASPDRVNQQMEAVVARHAPDEAPWSALWLQPLTDIHLYSADLTNTNTTRLGDARQVRILALLAVVVLVIACINYMNLATAQAQVRAREVGINKAVGATRGQVAARFYAETALVVFGSLLLGVGLVAVGLPMLNELAEKTLSFRELFTPGMALNLLGLGVGVTLVAGSYPALHLSSFAPKQLLQTAFRRNTGAGWLRGPALRRSLVVAQFTASLVLIIGTLVFYQQLRFIQRQKLGYEPTQVVAVMTAAAQSKAHVQALTDAYRSLSSVEAVCRAQVFPGTGGSGRSISRPGGDQTGTFIHTNRVGPEFIETLGLKLLAGRTLPAVEKADSDTTVQVVLNKTAVQFLGYTPEGAIGKIAPGVFENKAEIVGVVDDFHFLSLHQPIGAYAFHNADTEGRPYLLVKLRTGNLPETMKRLEAAYRERVPNSAFEFTFLDQFIDTLYRAERRTASVVLVFAGLAILIACLGLFGLATFTAEQRTKEIGVRKVLGASVASLVALLAKDFLKLVLVAVVLASPLAWYGMSRWLQGFAYKISLEWWMFAGAGLAALAVALLTVSFQSVRAALVNPVKSLRTE